MINCPSCGAALNLRSAGLPYSTCGYCRSLVFHAGVRVEDMGKVAVLPFDMSPVQLGTRFRAFGEELCTVGRVRWGWSGGAWNEWLLETGQTGTAANTHFWLAEAMGMFMLTRARSNLLDDPLVQTFAQGKDPVPGQALLVDGTLLRVTDVKHAACLGSEGDLPFSTLPGTSMVNVDFRSRKGSAVSLQRQGNEVSAWSGAWHELSDLTPSQVRQLEGWDCPVAMR